MSVGGRDSGSEFHHRARLFPLPLLPELAVCSLSRRVSARIRSRLKWRRIIVACTNRCISALNRMYSSHSSVHISTPPSSSSLLSQPDILPFPAGGASVSRQQTRGLVYLEREGAAFVRGVRACVPGSDDATKKMLELLSSGIADARGDASPASRHAPSSPADLSCRVTLLYCRCSSVPIRLRVQSRMRSEQAVGPLWRLRPLALAWRTSKRITLP